MMLPSGGRSSLTSAGYYEKLKYFTWLANDHPRIACLMRHRPTRLHVPERHFWGHLLLHRLFIDRVLLLPTPPPQALQQTSTSNLHNDPHATKAAHTHMQAPPTECAVAEGG